MNTGVNSEEKISGITLDPQLFIAGQSLDDLVEGFALFDDWEDRYRYLIDMGRKLPVMDDALKTENTIVHGCTSKVWLYQQVQKNAAGDDIVVFIADSDAQIVRGLIYVLMVSYFGQKLSAVPTIDIENIFNRMGLNEHLSPNRRNGFFSMVATIRSFTL